MMLPRLRQAVLAATDLAKASEQLESELGVGPPFHDAGIVHFGLSNAVHPLGDTFIEVVSPIEEGTAAGRQIARNGGDCGYMCMFELADIDAVRQRVADAGVRIVHDTTHDDIVDLHLHPKDVPGAIVALDVTDPPGSWRWAGPPWEGAVPAFGAGGLRGLTVAVNEPTAAAATWARLLGAPAKGTEISLDGGRQRVRFVAAGGGPERIVEVEVASPGREGAAIIGGVRFVKLPE